MGRKNAEKENANLKTRLESQGEFEEGLKTMNMAELIDEKETEIHALNSTGFCGHRFQIALIDAELKRREPA